MGHTPVWICCRSAEPWDIGHVWPLLARFQRVEVKPFHLSETRMLVQPLSAKVSFPATL